MLIKIFVIRQKILKEEKSKKNNELTKEFKLKNLFIEW